MRRILLRCIEFFKHYGREWDKLSPTKEEAIEFAHKNINEEPLKYIPNTLKATAFLTLARGGETINERLRNDYDDSDVPNVAKTISQIQCKKNLVLYRGITNETYQQMKDAAKEYENIDLYDKGFLQTSLVKGQEIKREIRLRIFVPYGTNVIYLGNVNDEEERYYEVDVQYGAKLKIVSMDKTYINCVLISTK